MTKFEAIVPEAARRLYDEVLMSPGIRVGELLITSGRIGVSWM